MVVAPFSSPSSSTVPEERPHPDYGITTVPSAADTVPHGSSPETIVASTVAFNRFSVLRFGRAMPAKKEGKRKVGEESSNEDSPSSVNGAVHTEKEWTTNAGGNWRSFTWAFGLSSSTSLARRRGRRGTTRKGTKEGGEEEKDPMQELLEIVLWNGEKEIDITEQLDYDSDEDDLAAIKRVMAREQTIRPRGAFGVSRMEIGGKKKSEERGGEGEEKINGVANNGLSVSNLRFDSLLKIGSTTESSKKSSILRLEQRTNTMENAFKGVLDDSYICETTLSSKKKSDLSTKTVSTATIVEGEKEGDEENFWDDVEF